MDWGNGFLLSPIISVFFMPVFWIIYLNNNRQYPLLPSNELRHVNA